MKVSGKGSAFSLVEVTIALGVTAICVLAVFGLLPIGLKTSQASNEQFSAAELAAAVDADLRATSKAASESGIFRIPMSGGGIVYVKDDGTVGGQADSRWRVEVILIIPSAGSKTATLGRIVVSWPAQQDDLAKVAGSEIAFIALDRGT